MNKKFSRKTLALIMSLTLVFSIFCIVPGANAKIVPSANAKSVPSANAKGEIDTAIWMEQLVTASPDVTVSQLTMPGTHDAGTYNIKFDGKSTAVKKAIEQYFPQNTFLQKLVNGPIVQKIVEVLQTTAGQCQSLSIKEQLEAGVRYFDLRYKFNEKDEQYYIYHGQSEGAVGVFANCACYNVKGDENVDKSNQLSLADVFATMSKFLEAHNKEAIFVELKNETGTYADGSTKTAQDVFIETVKQIAETGYTCNNKETVTVTEKLSTYQKNIVFANDMTESVDVDEGTLDKWQAEAKLLGMTLVDEKNKTIPGYEWPVRFKKYDVKYSLNQISTGKTPSSDKIFRTSLNVGAKIYKIHDECDECSLVNLVKTPLSQALQMNQIITDYLPKLNKGKPYGIISFDFANKCLCKDIIAMNYGNLQAGH